MRGPCGKTRRKRGENEDESGPWPAPGQKPVLPGIKRRGYGQRSPQGQGGSPLVRRAGCGQNPPACRNRGSGKFSDLSGSGFVASLVGLIGAVAVWLIVDVVYRITDKRLPWMFALGFTYAVAAYVVLPRTVRMSLKVLQRKSVPAFTVTSDGLPGDPVNLVLLGDFERLRAAFAKAGWMEADPLGLTSSWKMILAFAFARSYPKAPFSTLYLFGRKQDIGFQKAIDGSPRKRHHVRFWALTPERDDEPMSDPDFWLNTDRPALNEVALWVGAGTRDTGLGLTKFTLQVTHATDNDTNAERDFIVSELKRAGAIGEIVWRQEGDQLRTGKVNHYIADGEVAAARLN